MGVKANFCRLPIITLLEGLETKSSKLKVN